MINSSVNSRFSLWTKDNQTPLSFSSFKSDSKPKVYEKSLIQNFDSSSVLGKLLKDSMITSNVQEPRLATENLIQEKNVNVTKTQCDYKYYFWNVLVISDCFMSKLMRTFWGSHTRSEFDRLS